LTKVAESSCSSNPAAFLFAKSCNCKNKGLDFEIGFP
jgi:hypothetical protein